jgi:cytochrome c-type biogenesis protein CcmH/NrfF
MRVFYYYGGPFWVGWVIWLVVLVAIIVTVVLVARSSRRRAVYQRPWNGGP